jgi:hypothetical protein
MTHEMLAAARTYAELTEMAATVKGRELQALLDERGMTYLRSATVARKREALVDLHGRRLDSLAIAAIGRQLH